MRHGKVTSAIPNNGISKPIAQSGKVIENYGVLRKKTLTAAFGGKVYENSYLTFAVPYVTNERQSRSVAGVGDVSLVARHPLILQNFAEPLIPQLQVTGGYKFANARSINESKDREFLDARGTGFAEAKLGYDIWWGMADIRGGIAQNFIHPFARTFHGSKQQPGASLQTVLSLGAEIYPFVGVLGLSRTESQKRTVEGKSVAGSEIRTQNAFGSLSYKYTLLDVFLFTYTANGVGGLNKNSVRGNTYTLAFTKAWL